MNTAIETIQAVENQNNVIEHDQTRKVISRRVLLNRLNRRVGSCGERIVKSRMQEREELGEYYWTVPDSQVTQNKLISNVCHKNVNLEETARQFGLLRANESVGSNDAARACNSESKAVVVQLAQSFAGKIIQHQQDDSIEWYLRPDKFYNAGLKVPEVNSPYLRGLFGKTLRKFLGDGWYVSPFTWCEIYVSAYNQETIRKEQLSEAEEKLSEAVAAFRSVGITVEVTRTEQVR